MRNLEITGTVLAAVSGCVSSTTLSLALNGTRELRNDEGTKLLRTLDELVALSKKVYPLRLKLTNAIEIKGWLQLAREGSLFGVVGNQAGEEAAEPDQSAPAEESSTHE
jgi:hypothetical protein